MLHIVMSAVLAAATLTADPASEAAAQRRAAEMEFAYAKQQAEAARQALASQPKVTLEFKGGSLAELLTAIRSANPEINIISGEDAAHVGVPSMSLKESPIGGVLKALEGLELWDLTDKSPWRVNCTSSGNVYAVSPEAVPDPHKPSASAPNEVRVWGLKPVIESGVTADAALSAVQAALAMTGEKAEVKFHAETGLLLVSAPPQGLDTVNQVVHTLESQSRTGNAAIKRMAEMEKQIAELQAQLDAARQANQSAR